MNNPTAIDVPDLVTSRIIKQLSQGIIPWKISWNCNGQPKNLLTEKKYRGINTWLLNGHGYTQNLFLTEAQVNGVQAKIKPGEDGYPIIYWKILKKDEQPSIQHIL